MVIRIVASQQGAAGDALPAGAGKPPLSFGVSSQDYSMSKKKTIWEKASLWAATVGVVATLVGATSTFFLQATNIESAGIEFQLEPTEIVGSPQYSDLANELELIKDQFSTITAIPEDTAVASKLAELESRLDKLAQNIKTINKAIMQSPEKALEIPMLKRDVQALQNQYKASTEALEREITRAYDTIKWVIGTIVLGIIGLAASVFLREGGGED